MNQLTLYSRLVCPLCDEAEALLLEAGLDVIHVIIDDSLPLLERYRNRVPVLADSAGAELDWPWDLAGLSAWLKTQA